MSTLSDIQKLMTIFKGRAINKCLLDEMHQYVFDNVPRFYYEPRFHFELNDNNIINIKVDDIVTAVAFSFIEQVLPQAIILDERTAIVMDTWKVTLDNGNISVGRLYAERT